MMTRIGQNRCRFKRS